MNVQVPSPEIQIQLVWGEAEKKPTFQKLLKRNGVFHGSAWPVYCYRLFVFPPNSYVKTLCPPVRWY